MRSEPGKDLHHLVFLITVSTRKPKEVTTPSNNLAQTGRISHDGDSPAPFKLEKPFVAQVPQGSKHRVVVDTANRGHVASWGEASSGLHGSFSDLTTQFRRDLEIEREGIAVGPGHGQMIPPHLVSSS